MKQEPIPQPLTLRDVLGVFKRQRLPMALIVVLSLVGGAAAIKLTKPMFRSTTEILVEGRTANYAGQNPNDPVAQVTLPNQDQDILTQIEVLQSAKLLSETFNAAGVTPPDETLPPAQRMALMPIVKVDQVGATNVLRVSVDSLNPDAAERLAMIMPQVYATYVKQSRQGEVENALSFLTQQLGDEEKLLQKAQNDLETYKKARAMVPLVSEGEQRSVKVSSSQTDVERAGAEVAASQERLNTLVAERNKLSPTISNPATQANTAAIEAQKSVIANLKAQREALLRSYLPDAPAVKELDAQIETQEQRLLDIPKVADTSSKTMHPELLAMESKIADARASLKASQAQYRKLYEAKTKAESSLKNFNDISSTQDKLERAVSDRKDSILTIRKGLEELKVRRNAARDAVTVLTPAQQAEKVKPRGMQYMALAFLMGSFFAVGFALIKDGLDDKVTSAEDVYQLTGLQPVGEIPALPKRAPVLAKAELDEALMESYRILRFNLLFSTLENPIKSIVVTSAGPGEGKTELACNLAVAASGEGRRVILVDANLRNPSIHKKMNVDGKPGLTDVVLGEAELETSLHQTAVPGLQVLTCGSHITAPTELLSSTQMQEVYARLVDSADLVIFDAPGCLASADAQVLSNVAGSVLFVAKSGSTKRTNVRRGLDSLKQANANVLGVAMSGAVVKGN